MNPQDSDSWVRSLTSDELLGMVEQSSMMTRYDLTQDSIDTIGNATLPSAIDGPAALYSLPEHPQNHFVSAPFKTALKDIGTAWHKACPQSAALLYNDMSLPQGALYDYKNTWKPPHDGHRFGNNADISKKWVRKGNRQKLIKLMCKHAIVQSEGDVKGEAPHYHLTSKNSQRKEDFDEKIISCCDDLEHIPKECTELGPDQPEEMPEVADCP